MKKYRPYKKCMFEETGEVGSLWPEEFTWMPAEPWVRAAVSVTELADALAQIEATLAEEGTAL